MPPEHAVNPAIQDPRRLVQSQLDPVIFWVLHHNGIFLSADRSTHWRRIDASPSSFGFAVTAHPKNAQAAWFVSAVKDEKRYPVDFKFVVSRTDDAGQTFNILRMVCQSVTATIWSIDTG